MSSSTNEDSQRFRLELAERIYQFLRFESESNSQSISESSRESLTVAAECVEQAFGLTKPQLDRPPSDELLRMYIRNAGGETSTSSPMPLHSEPKKTRKFVSAEDKQKAEELKNQGNDLMKQDKHKEACDYYSKAIELDDNNAVYYSNRAAAHSKMGNHELALKDCEDAIEIDPSYSKAYGRMGLAYASMEQHERAKESYGKAMQLDPTNQSYQNNYSIAEEIIRSQRSGGANLGANPSNVANDITSMLNDPNALNNIMRRIQDPAISNIIGNVMTAMSSNIFSGANPGQAPEGQATNTQNTQHSQEPGQEPQQAEAQPENPHAPPQAPNPAAGLTQLLAAGQQIASALSASNPQLMTQIEQLFQRPSNEEGNNEGPPPPGYS